VGVGIGHKLGIMRIAYQALCIYLPVVFLLTQCGVSGFKKNIVKPHTENSSAGATTRVSGAQIIGDNSQGFQSGIGGKRGRDLTFTEDDILPEDQIYWAPEDPDEAFDPEIEAKWHSRKDKSAGGWQRNFVQVVRESRVESKPIMLWFADTSSNNISTRLSDELFAKPKFQKWATENFVMMIVDKAPNIDDNQKTRQRKKVYYEKIKKRYRVLAHPEVLILTPHGEVQERYRGYKTGNSVLYWGRLKQGLQVADRDYYDYRNEMEAKGYRNWEGANGAKVFAKLYKFKGTSVQLIEADGRRLNFDVTKLSGPDQKWIYDEKEKYEIARSATEVEKS